MSLGCGDRGSAISRPVLSACSRSRGDWTDRGDWSRRHDLEGRAACGSRILRRGRRHLRGLSPRGGCLLPKPHHDRHHDRQRTPQRWACRRYRCHPRNWGLGHLGVQFARKMGFRTVAIGGGPDKEHLAIKLGAHIYVDAKAEEAAAALQKLGGAQVILATAPSGSAIGSLLPGLAVRGKLVAVGVSEDPIPLNGVPLIFGGRSVVGSLTGRAIETQDTLDFSVLTDVRPIIETLPLAKAEEAYKRMMEGKARFRMVLTMT